VKELETVAIFLKTYTDGWDCGSSVCEFTTERGGMRVNGPCTCFEEHIITDRPLQRIMRRAFRLLLKV
jgi:hypothetical protein